MNFILDTAIKSAVIIVFFCIGTMFSATFYDLLPW